MPIQYPVNIREIADRIAADLRAQGINPWTRDSYIGPLSIALAGEILEFYRQMRELQRESIPSTSTGEFLREWGHVKGLIPNPASQASGPITLTGVAGTVIPSGTALISRSGNLYDTQSSATISAQTLAISSIVRIGSTAYATTTSNHPLASGMSVVIAGANQAEYNGTKTITVTGLNLFEFPVSGAPVTPATGTITASATLATATVKSVAFGAAQNLSNGSTVDLSSPIAGADQTARVQYAEVGGAADAETESAFSARVIHAYQQPYSLFNPAAIQAAGLAVPGVTRIIVQSATPTRGQVTIYCMRDNDTGSPIPSASEIQAVKDAILAIKPAHVADVDVIVGAPIAVPVNFVFTSLSPNTATMRDAIHQALVELFSSVHVGSSLTEPSWDAAIYNAVDLTTGASRPTFALSSPTPPSVTIATGEIAILGTITWP